MMGWPKTLPRFAQAYRVCLDHPTYANTRILTSEWQMATFYHKAESDFFPLLAKAGKIGIIACTAPRHYRDYSTASWYGDKDYPEIFWHQEGDVLKCIYTDELVRDWCRRAKIDFELFHKPL